LRLLNAVGATLIIVGLQYLPALALGPAADALPR
jgi:K+-transporting ATPase ATPase A chain